MSGTILALTYVIPVFQLLDGREALVAVGLTHTVIVMS